MVRRTGVVVCEAYNFYVVYVVMSVMECYEGPGMENMYGASGVTKV